MLEVKDLAVAYGRVQAVKGISFSVEQGTIVSLLGTNGAGKTTTLRTISGLLRPTAGEILFEGKRIDTVPAHQIVTLGIAQSPEGRRLFPRMSVEDNLLLGAYTRKDTAGIREDLDRAYALFPVLGERRGQAAGLFSGGEQQMLAIARAMMSRPRLLMLDEPSMGLSPIMTTTIMNTIAELKATGTTILLVEQNAQAALALSDPRVRAGGRARSPVRHRCGPAGGRPGPAHLSGHRRRPTSVQASRAHGWGRPGGLGPGVARIGGAHRGGDATTPMTMAGTTATRRISSPVVGAGPTWSATNKARPLATAATTPLTATRLLTALVPPARHGMSATIVV